MPGSHPTIQSVNKANMAGEDADTKAGSTHRSASTVSGSLTVEAALALPVMMGACLLLAGLLNVLLIAGQVNACLCRTVRECAVYSMWENDLFVPEVLVSFYSHLGDSQIDFSKISGGKAGIWVTTDRQDPVFGLKAVYRVKVTGFILPGFTIPLSDRVSARAWTGVPLDDQSGDGEGDRTMVYVAENGVVYHMREDCTYIHLSVRTVSYATLDLLRNKDGSRYKACHYCRGKEHQGTVYVTDMGDAWHTDSHCSGLKRTLAVMTLENARERGLRGCGRCGG